MFRYDHTPYYVQFSIIESISLATEYMSTAKGGKGGVVVNTASLTGEQFIFHFLLDATTDCMLLHHD